MTTKNYSITSLFLILFFGIIGLTSCKKEEIKTELGEPVSEINTVYYDYEDDTVYCPNVIDYKTEIITSNWEEQISLFPPPTDIDFFDENFGVMSNMSSVFITYDGGANWNYKPTSMNATFFKVKTFGIDKFYLSRIGIQKTEDGGDTYSNFGNLTDNNASSIFNFHFFDSAHALICLGGSIQITHNAGQDWERKEDVQGRNIQFLSNEIGYISGGYSGGGIAGGFFSDGDIYKTINGGETWKRLNVNPLEITAMYFTDENTGIFTDFNGIVYQTIDGGTTWQIINDALCGNYVSDMIFTDKDTGYLAAGSIIFKTEDGGKTWIVDYYSGKKNSYDNHLNVHYLAKTPNNTVYVTGDITMKRVE